MNIGDYPLGARYDSNAPYNESLYDIKPCPYCFGTGVVSECCGDSSVDGYCTTCGEESDEIKCGYCDGEGDIKYEV